MGKSDALAIIDGGAIQAAPRKGKKGKKGKKGGGGDNDVFADEVQDMAYEAAATVGIQKIYFGGQMERIQNDAAIPPERKQEAKRDYSAKFLLGSIVARRIFKRGTMLGAAARGASAVAAVNLGQNL